MQIALFLWSLEKNSLDDLDHESQIKRLSAKVFEELNHPADQRDLGSSVPWFPVVGILIGLISGLFQWFLSLFMAFIGLLTIGLSVFVTGAFHEDGLAELSTRK